MTIGWPYTSSHVVLDTERGGAVPQEHSDLLKRMRTKITGSGGIVYVSLFWFPLSDLCLGVLVRASLVCLFVCVHGHLTRVQSCSHDYRAVTLNCALLFFYPGVKLFFCMCCAVEGVWFCFPSRWALNMSLVVICVCHYCLGRLLHWKDDGDPTKTQQARRYEVMSIFLPFLQRDWKESYTRTQTHNYKWQAFNKLIVYCFHLLEFSSGKTLSIYLSTIDWLGTYKRLSPHCEVLKVRYQSELTAKWIKCFHFRLLMRKSILAFASRHFINDI